PRQDVRPLHTDFGIAPQQRPLILSIVCHCAFIREIGHVAQNAETVCKSRGNVELPVILIAQFDAMPLAESGRAAAEIDCDIEDRSASHPNQLSLWMLP